MRHSMELRTVSTRRRPMRGAWPSALALAGGLALTLGASPAQGGGNPNPGGGGNPNPGVSPPHASAFGASYGEWSGSWWQWAYSMPQAEHPLFDTADCSEGQAGNVWFLGGAFGSPDEDIVRECTIPPGTALFFPVLNLVFTVTEPDETVEEGRELVILNQDQATGMFATLERNGDLMEIVDIEDYRLSEPEQFTIGPVPEGSLGDDRGLMPGEIYDAVGDGVYLMLAPLPVGEHVLHFGGSYPQFAFSLDITYIITVDPQA